MSSIYLDFNTFLLYAHLSWSETTPETVRALAHMQASKREMITWNINIAMKATAVASVDEEVEGKKWFF